MAMDRDGNVILGGVERRRRPDRHPPAGRRQPGPDVRRRRRPSTAPSLGLTRPRHRPARARRRDADLHRRRRPDRVYPATFTVVRLGADRRARPDVGRHRHRQRRRSARAGRAGIGAAAMRQGPSGTTLVAGTDLTAAGTPRGAVIRLHAGRHARTPASAARASPASRAPAARSGSRRWSATAPAGSCSPAPASRPRAGHPPARQRRPRHDLRQRRPHLPAARPPARRRPDLHALDAIDAAGSARDHRRLGRRPGPADPRRRAGTVYTGRFALTVSRLQ